MGGATHTKPITTEFIVSVNAQPHKAEVEFAEMLGDLSFVEKWREALGTNPEPKQREAVDLAQLARERFVADSRVGQPYLSTAEGLAGLIHGEPESEVGAFILLKCQWFSPSRFIGLCHFRRTWCNNIVVDYLATHPLILREGTVDQVKVKGVGLALLCFISRLAVANSCTQMWGEATLGSHPYYEHIFDLKGVTDLFIIPPENYMLCANRKLDWQPQEGVNTMNMQAVEELYDVEEKHPPLVGNRTQMVGSKRQLINHFLDLPRYKQDEVAKTLGLLNDEDANILEDQWCGILFQRAVKAGKLRELWDEVEKRHEHGEPENNPFIG